jgi:hypothetical protein
MCLFITLSFEDIVLNERIFNKSVNQEFSIRTLIKNFYGFCFPDINEYYIIFLNDNIE